MASRTQELADVAGGNDESKSNVSCCIIQQADQNNKWIYTCHIAAHLFHYISCRKRKVRVKQKGAVMKKMAMEWQTKLKSWRM